MTRHVASLGTALAMASLLACGDRPTAPDALAPSQIAAALPGNAARAPAAPLASVNWEATAGTLVSNRSVAPIVAARAYGLLGIAQYAAATAAAPGSGADDEENSDPSPRAHYYEMRGAVAGASAQVLSYLFPLPLDVATIEGQVAREGAEGSTGVQNQFARGVALGRAIGDIVVLRGRGDGFTKADGTPQIWDPTSLPTGADIWRMDADATPHVPSGFQFPAMRPYYLTSTSQFRPPPPPTAVADAVKEVIAIVNARTPAQAAIARFWNLNLGSVTALGYWDQQAAKYIDQYGLDERDAAHVFALVNSAGSDAILGCWEAKYYHDALHHYLVLRPWMVAPADLTNDKLIIGRPNHPSYPSGHSCVSSAAARVLAEFFPRETATLEQEVAEAGMSRIYAGIHYRMDIDAGQALGRSVAQWAIDYDRQRGLLSAVFPANR